MITLDQFKKAFPTISAVDQVEWTTVLDKAMEAYEIDTPAEVAAFLAQCSWESAAFTGMEENLFYTAPRLQQVFKHAFADAATAQLYERKPQRIANKVYANRLGNGNELSGDGWKYRGRGLFQLTGPKNYMACGQVFGKDLVADPDYIATKEGAARSAAWYWKANGCNLRIAENNFDATTRAINGAGMLGKDGRRALYAKLLPIFGG